MSITHSSCGLRKGLTAGFAVLVLMGGMASTASAGSIIFQDNFNRGYGKYKYSSTVGNGWYETEKNYNDVAITYNHLQLRDSRFGLPDAAASRWIDTRGYDNLSLMYDFKPLSNSDYSDKFYVDFRTLGNNSWTNIATHKLGGNSWTWNTASLGSYANDTKLQLRFWTNVTDTYAGNYEGTYIDNVKLMGDPIAAPAAVPEPSTMALFATGMVGMGLWRARRNKKEQAASIE
ncbi:MAG: hypothetical protein NPIRA02_21300 [Nitrospirales bacterium]|nr:MAG: hypothetical protein NPIRA02_21300 [Nitrospirales bacterium]